MGRDNILAHVTKPLSEIISFKLQLNYYRIQFILSVKEQ